MRAVLRATTLLLLSVRAAPDDTRDWYDGDIVQVPDYHLFPRRPLNAVNLPLLFSCSAATLDPIRFRWRVQHPVQVNITLLSSSRSLFVDRQKNVYVRDAILELSSSTPHVGVVKCKLLDLQGGTLIEMRTDYQVVDDVSLNHCDNYTYCHRDRAVCAVTDVGLECVCREDYPNRDDYHGVCYAGVALGDTCVFDHECQAKTNYSWCQDTVCACKPSYRSVSSRCVLTAKLGDPCGNESMCTVNDAACLQGRCRCVVPSEDVDGVCLEKKNGSARAVPRAFKALSLDAPSLTSLAIFFLVVAMITLYHIVLDLHYKRLRRAREKLERL